MKGFSKNKIKVLIEMRLIIVVKLYNNFCCRIWYGRFRYVIIEGGILSLLYIGWILFFIWIVWVSGRWI